MAKGVSMFRKIAAAAVVAVMTAGGAPAQEQAVQEQNRAPAGLDWYVISQLNGFYDDIDDPTNRPPLLTEPPAGVVRAVDVNGDGVNDWVVNWPQGGQFCGTGGCRFTVYLADGPNLVRIFDRQTFEPLDVSVVDGEARFEGSFHHLACDDTRDPCRLAWGLDTEQKRLVPRRSANGDAYSSGDDQDVIDPTWEGRGGDQD